MGCYKTYTSVTILLNPSLYCFGYIALVILFGYIALVILLWLYCFGYIALVILLWLYSHDLSYVTANITKV
jgi:hypothetical protein